MKQFMLVISKQFNLNKTLKIFVKKNHNNSVV